MQSTFGEYIKNLRSERGLTLTQLGAQIGVDSGALSKIENGKKKLDEKALPKLAKVFKLDLNTLKDEYFSEIIAYEIFENNCSENVFTLAEKKIKYIRKNAKRKRLGFN